MDAVQQGVLARTPVAARRIRYLGAAGVAFADACLGRNPRCDVVLEAGNASPVEALAADDLAGLLILPDAASLLAATEVVTTAMPAGTTDPNGLLNALVNHGFEVRHLQPLDPQTPDPKTYGYFDDIRRELTSAWAAGGLPAPTTEPVIVVATRLGGPASMQLAMFSFVPLMMDIRTRLPAAALRSEPGLLTQHVRPPGRLEPAARDTPKVVIIQRPAPPKSIEGWKQSIRDWVRDGWVSVVEFDDHPTLAAMTGGREMVEADWVRFSAVHAVQTSTPLLEGLFRELNPETRSFSNAVFRLEPFPENLPKRVFYGAIQRGDHAVEMARSLGPAIARFPGVEFVVVGDRAVFDAIPTSRKRYFDLVSYEEYLRLMGGCSILLSPIEDNEFNAAKSDAKFLDAASRGVLTIASRAVYGGVIRHGENGLIAERTEDWARLLADALADDVARREMARVAWTYVRDQRMFADQVRERLAWYRDLWERREELNAAVLARL
ncbi:glycosyltransferase [Phenylobacterium sp.]|uniref:glycosyltransferase n=1 Tax=Phenylobacterium sp. TaxID=1871053 RepID=UPI0025EDA312|nr:glycosyltransferase [Phenylobacterium sp.]